MRWQTSGDGEERWWGQTHSNVGMGVISDLLEFYFTWVDNHILRVSNCIEPMQRAFLRARIHQSKVVLRVKCYDTESQGEAEALTLCWGCRPYPTKYQQNMPAAKSPRSENIDRWWNNRECPPHPCLWYTGGTYSNIEKIRLGSFIPRIL